MSALGFPELLLGVLRFSGDEFVSICHKTNGGPFCTAVCSPTAGAAEVQALPERADIYFGVNPVKGPARRNGGRGKAADVTRLSALFADLDVKSGACPNLEVAQAIIDDLSAILGTQPSAVTHSGGGLHPYWPITNERTPDDMLEATLRRRRGDPDPNPDPAGVLERWGRLVKMVAGGRGVQADSVFDRARVLRVPGTYNNKVVTVGQGGIPVICHAHDGKALTLTEIDTRLEAHGVRQIDDYPESAAQISDPNDWEFSSETCNYAEAMIDAWADPATVEQGTGRHPWLLGQAVRLNCAKRLGCITETDFEHTKEVVEMTFTHLCATREPVREVAPSEISDIWKAAAIIAAAKTALQARAELGDHKHPDQLIDDEPFWSSRPVLSDLRQFARARRVGPWAMFGCVLARVVGSIPPTVVLPPLVGSHASLNLFVALVGPSGAGKGAASGAAADWLTTGPAAFTATLGSGEGMAKMFAYKRRMNGRTGPWVQEGLRASVLFDAPEVDNLIALTTRSSSTLLPQLRSAYSGEELGFSYADPAKAVRLCAHRYRLCLTVGVQPGRGKPLLDDADGGTPQRFVWLPTGDMQAPDEPPELPAHSDLQPWPDQPVGRLVSGGAPAALLDTPVTDAELRVVGVPDAVRDAIDSHRVATLRGGAVDPLDGHRLLCWLKVAAALMWLDGRTKELSNDDWSLAGIVMVISDRTRCGVADVLRSKAHAENASRGRAEGLREIAKTEVVQSEQVERLQRVADNIERKLKDNGGELARGSLRKMIHFRDRSLFDDAEAVLTQTGRVDKLPSDNNGPGGFVLRLAGEGAGK